VSSQEQILSLGNIEKILQSSLIPTNVPVKFEVERKKLLPTISDKENIEVVESVSSITSGIGQVGLTSAAKPIGFDVSVLVRKPLSEQSIHSEFDFGKTEGSEEISEENEEEILF